MPMFKKIHWSQGVDAGGLSSAFVDIIISNTNPTVKNYSVLLKEMHRTFPQASEEEVWCGMINDKGRFDGYTIISWRAQKLLKADYQEWEGRSGHAEYLYPF